MAEWSKTLPLTACCLSYPGLNVPQGMFVLNFEFIVNLLTYGREFPMYFEIA